MRIFFALTAAALALLPVTALADETAALAPAIAQCISGNAAKVEAAVPDLNQAVDFLVSDVCAEPVAADQARATRRSTEQQTARMQKICDEKTANKSDPKDIKADAWSGYCGTLKIGFLTEPNDDEGGYTLYGYNALNKPAAAVALASHLLLDLRFAHLKRQP